MIQLAEAPGPRAPRATRGGGVGKRSRRHRELLVTRAMELLRREPQYIYDATFDAPGAAAEILNSDAHGAPTVRKRGRVTAAKEGLDFYTASLYEVPLLSREREQHLFRKMNFLKFRAHRLRQKLNPRTASARQIDQIEQLEADALRVRNEIVEANLRLTVALAKKYSNGSRLQFEELLSEGHEALIRAVDHFDFSRGTKLSTYATWVVRNAFLAHFEREKRHARRRSREEDNLIPDELADQAPMPRSERANLELRSSLGRLLENLNSREKTIIEARFGLNDFSHTHTLPELGRRFGVSKERVRQLQIVAMQKLRCLAEEDRLEPPED